MTSSATDDEGEWRDCEGPYVQGDADRAAHDIRASLLIVNGFHQVLDSNFADLCEAYQKILDIHPDILQTALAANVKQLETDCLSSISQVRRSVERLSNRISDQGQASSNVDHDGSRDAS